MELRQYIMIVSGNKKADFPWLESIFQMIFIL